MYSTGMQEPTELRRDFRASGTGVIGDSELPDVGAGSQNGVLCKRS